MVGKIDSASSKTNQMASRLSVKALQLQAAVFICLCLTFGCTNSSYVFEAADQQLQPLHLKFDGREITEPEFDEPKTALTGTVRLNVRKAISLALENNPSLRIDRLDPKIKRTEIERARAKYDAKFTYDASLGQSQSEMQARFGSGTEQQRSTIGRQEAGLSIESPSGTKVGLEYKDELNKSTLYEDEFLSTRVGLTMTQALLRGASIDANLATLRQAKVDLMRSQFNFRSSVESLVANVEKAVWNYSSAQRRIEIFEAALDLANLQLANTEQRIKVGRIATTELAGAQADQANREQDLINAKNDLARARLELLKLIQPETWTEQEVQLILDTNLDVQTESLDSLQTHIKLAQRFRPDINEAKLSIQRGDFEITRTKNGLLPKLDFYVSAGLSGYGSSYEQAKSNMNSENYDVQAGLSFEWAFGNRQSRAEYSRALYSRRQSQYALENLLRVVSTDVERAYLEVHRTRALIKASEKTRIFREQALENEQRKFAVGKSTTLLVSQAQSDFVNSQITELQAKIDCMQALIELYRVEGSLLKRRGIDAPGAEPIQL